MDNNTTKTFTREELRHAILSAVESDTTKKLFEKASMLVLLLPLIAEAVANDVFGKESHGLK